MTAPALWTKHRNIARAIAADYFIPGADRDDVRQEADIALWEAASHYLPGHGPFPPFARIVVKRRLADRLTAAHRAKRRVLTEAVRDLDELVAVDPLGDREELRRLVRAVHDLNALDRAAVARIVNGVPIVGKTDDTQRYRAKRRLKERLVA